MATRNVPTSGRSSAALLNRSYGGSGGKNPSTSVRGKIAPRRRSVTPTGRLPFLNHDSEPGRVRVAVRVRPRNAEEQRTDADFADCVELHPELKRLKLKKNNWDADSYKFDEVFSESASQRRIYEVVAKPVVESVLSGYNGTIMAYGQTGTGKTYTVGGLGKDDASERGIMVRSMEDIMASISPAFDTIEVSYLQLYMEAVQDLLAPEKTNIPILEDSKTGEVNLPGASIVKIQNLHDFVQLLQTGETNRHAANTKMNTESSRSHAILMVYIRRSVQDVEMDEKKESESDLLSGRGVPTVRKSKLLIVDLAGSERLDKSGSEGHMVEEAKFINLSLSSLGKCINALAENSPHTPTRDSKLTRLLRDSFGGSARTSLIITIGPSARHHGETSSTIMFGQRAMKIVNVVKLKEEFDYEGLCRNLKNEVEHLNIEIDRQQKLRESGKIELERELIECKQTFAEAEKDLLSRSEFLEKENEHLEKEVNGMIYELNRLKEQNGSLNGEISRLKESLNEIKKCQHEGSTYQRILADTTQMYEKKIADMTKQLENEEAHSARAEKELESTKALLSDQEKLIQSYQMESSSYQKALADTTQMYEEKISELIQELDNMHASCEGVEEKLNTTKEHFVEHQKLKQTGGQTEIDELKLELNASHQLHQKAANEIELLKLEHRVDLEEKVILSEEVSALREKLFAEKKQRKALETELYRLQKDVPESDENFVEKKSYMKETIAKPLVSHKSTRETRATIAKYCEQVGLEKILKSLTSESVDVQIQAVKVIANLAAEDINQEKIVEEGGLDALLMLVQSSQNSTVLRVASGAIANLAMNEIHQTLIVSKGGAQLLANTASKTNDPQTLRMVAGAIANLCGNEKLHFMLIEDGATKALLDMALSGNCDIISQVARGISNFAKCESRAVVQGHRKGRSILMEDGALTWLIENSSTISPSSRRHIELALCHLAQNEENARDFITSGGVRELAKISVESTREDIRNLAKKMLKLFPLNSERR